MLFNTWEFALFFGIVFAAYHLMAKRSQNLLLLGASYFFYGWWDWRFCSLLALSTVVDYTVARLMVNHTGRKRKALLLVSVITNLSILGFFKYFNFFMDSTANMLSSVGFNPDLPTLYIILPVGISFYTFQTMAYTIDVYRGKLKPCRDPIVFGVYVSYFPQLVAGPIERAQNLLPQFAAVRRVTADHLSSGTILILIGLLRKVVIADGVAPMVNSAFGDPTGATSLELTRAVLCFSLQIYGDFAGYSDMARGVSRLLGIELMENFQQPYFATSITSFWRRWHVSLSTWLRDYLYIPLGGNRGPKWFVYRNLLLTMLLGGLWHGAAWTFVIWGAIHGLALAVHKLYLGDRKPDDTINMRNPLSLIKAGTCWAVTMFVVALAWVFFRAQSFESAIQVISGIFAFRGSVDAYSLRVPVFMVLLILLIDIPQAIKADHTVVLRWPVLARGVTYAAMMIVLAVYGNSNDVPFIYFQF